MTTRNTPTDLRPACASDVRAAAQDKPAEERQQRLRDLVDVSHDPVAHPSHYTSSPAKCSGCGKPIECIDVAKHWTYSLGAALKYLWRNGQKDGADAIEDLRKARQYLEFEVERLGGEA